MGRPATQHEARKDQIVQAAIDTFSRYGFEGTTNKLIAKAAGLNSAALIYHYFPNKESLFRACLYSFSEMDSLKSTLESDTDLEPEAYLTNVVTTYLRILRDPRLSRLLPMFLGTLQSHQELIPLLVERIESVLWLPVSNYLQKRMQRGEIRQITSASALQMFLGPVVVRIISRVFTSSSVLLDGGTDDDFAHNLVQTFLSGVLVKQVDS